MPAWPPSLPPIPLAGTFNRRADDNVIRTQNDVGEPMRRTRYTAIPKRHSFSMVLTRPQMETLDMFYDVDLGSGVLGFLFSDPVTNAVATFSFAEPFTLEDASSPDLYRVSMTLIQQAA